MTEQKIWPGKPSRAAMQQTLERARNGKFAFLFTRQALASELVLLTAVLLSMIFIVTQPSPPKNIKEEKPILVDIVITSRDTHETTIYQQGTVIPAREIQLHSEVTGKVIEMSNKLIPGGRFNTEEKLLQLDPRDYEYIVQQKKAQLEEARLFLKEEQSRKEIAKEEWKLLGDQITTNRTGRDLALRTAHLRRANASFSAAQNALLAAELNLSRTSIHAPFNCFVQEESVDIGKLITPQTSMAKLIGTDTFWVQVSVPTQDLQWLILPKEDGTSGSSAKIIQKIGKDEENSHTGQLIKLIGDIRPDTRTARLLIEIKDPLQLSSGYSVSLTPLLLGSWVDVQLEGKMVVDSFILPNSSIREGNLVWIMNEENRLTVRKIKVLRYQADDTVLIRDGLKDRERVITSRIPAALPGMMLRLNRENKDRS